MAWGICEALLRKFDRDAGLPNLAVWSLQYRQAPSAGEWLCAGTGPDECLFYATG
jgi:hypothetical protein